MNDQFQAFLDKIKLEMQAQTNEILSQMDEKLSPLVREIEDLKSENEKLKDKIQDMEKKKRMKNLILFGLEETEKSTTDLMETTLNKIKTDLNISLNSNDINFIYRLGKKNSSNKCRPTLVSFVNGWKKTTVMQNKKRFQGIYATEDYPKEVLDKRRKLQQQMAEERKKGNFAIIKYDKLIVQENTKYTKKRKERDSSSSPKTNEQPQTQKTFKANPINAFDRMRRLSNSNPTFGSTSSINKA